MSSITINGDTSGSVILQAPSVAGSTTLTLPTTTGTLVTSNAMPTGSVLQVVSATKTDTASVSSATFADITGLSVSITPSSSSSKILIIASINLSWQNGVTKGGARLMRDSTAIAIGDAAGSRGRVTGSVYVPTENYSSFVVASNYLDSPSTTSAVTYKWQFAAMDNTGTVYVNRANYDADGISTTRTVSSITVMEIKG